MRRTTVRQILINIDTGMGKGVPINRDLHLLARNDTRFDFAEIRNCTLYRQALGEMAETQATIEFLTSAANTSKP